jgi:hypothetical protein
MIADVIVIASGVFAAAFSVAWLLRRDLREWIERPKYQFQDAVRQYDRDQAGMSGGEERSRG